MKRRFVFTIGIVMALAITSVGILQYALFRGEQYRLIDSRIESTATLLLTSDLSTAELKEFEEAEDIIAEVVGGERFNQFIIIYDRNHRELYRSPTAESLPEQIPLEPKWQQIEADGHFIRVLTVPFAKSSKSTNIKEGRQTRILQTGLILDDDILRLKNVSRHVILYSIMILCLILLTTAWLSETLLRPLKELAQYLRYVGGKFSESPVQPEVIPPISLVKAGDDEFGQLVKETYRLRDLIGQSLRNTQVWTAQMAHEMKTPLTIIQNSLERARTESETPAREKWLDEASNEIGHLNGLISSFLEWSAAENFPRVEEEMHASRLGPVAKNLAEKFELQFPGRIRHHGDSKITVFAKRGFVQQAISNLIMNALRYSPNESPVTIEVSDREIRICDEGPGLPESVLKHLGEPFNYGKNDTRGFGLGLAWVRTICSKYDWELSFRREMKMRDGTERTSTIAQIVFPPEED